MKFVRIKQFWIKLRLWANKHPKTAWISGSLAILLLSGVITFFVLSRPATPEVVVKKIEPKPKVIYYSPLTGKTVTNEAATKIPVTGIMIENSPDARPQSGLKKSGVVFEAIAEGGITRFLVLYQQEKPTIIGPVRSLRFYDIDWLAAFDASIGHVGGSAASLKEIRNGSYRDLDQFFNAGSYWRATDRYAPHNVYTNFKNLDALNKSKGYKTSIFTGFNRVDGKPEKTPTAKIINITISSTLFNNSYIYNPKTNTYNRSQAGEPHLDREYGQISPSVVIAMRVNEKTVLEDGYRQSITTIGSGKAVIFQNGIAIKAIWHKKDKLHQITFTDVKGKDVPLIRGQTWISAVPNDGGDVTWK